MPYKVKLLNSFRMNRKKNLIKVLLLLLAPVIIFMGCKRYPIYFYFDEEGQRNYSIKETDFYLTIGFPSNEIPADVDTERIYRSRRDKFGSGILFQNKSDTEFLITLNQFALTANGQTYLPKEIAVEVLEKLTIPRDVKAVYLSPGQSVRVPVNRLANISVKFIIPFEEAWDATYKYDFKLKWNGNEKTLKDEIPVKKTDLRQHSP